MESDTLSKGNELMIPPRRSVHFIPTDPPSWLTPPCFRSSGSQISEILISEGSGPGRLRRPKILGFRAFLSAFLAKTRLRREKILAFRDPILLISRGKTEENQRRRREKFSGFCHFLKGFWSKRGSQSGSRCPTLGDPPLFSEIRPDRGREGGGQLE